MSFNEPVGIFEIDLEHAQIDAIFQLYADGFYPSRTLGRIVPAIIDHIRNEENFFSHLGEKLPAAHSKDHQRMLAFLQEKQTAWKSGELENQIYADEIRQVFATHVMTHDMNLAI